VDLFKSILGNNYLHFLKYQIPTTSLIHTLVAMTILLLYRI